MAITHLIGPAPDVTANRALLFHVYILLFTLDRISWELWCSKGEFMVFLAEGLGLEARMFTALFLFSSSLLPTASTVVTLRLYSRRPGAEAVFICGLFK
jgi:hypothetical protein